MLETRFNFLITIIVIAIYLIFFNYLQIFYILFCLVFLYFCMIPEIDLDEDFEEPESFCLPWLQFNLKKNNNDKNIVFLRKYLKMNKAQNIKKFNFMNSKVILKLSKNYFFQNLSKNNFYSVLKLLYYNKVQIIELSSHVYFETKNLFLRNAYQNFFFNESNVQYNPLNYFHELKKDYMLSAKNAGDIANTEISIIRDLFLDECNSRDSYKKVYNHPSKIREPRGIYSDNEDFFDIDFFNGKFLKKSNYTNEFFVTEPILKFDKWQETDTRKELRKEAELAYINKLKKWKKKKIKKIPPFVMEEKRMFNAKRINYIDPNVLYFYEDHLDLFENNFYSDYSAGMFFHNSFNTFFFDLCLKFNKKKPKLFFNLKDNLVLLNLNKYKHTIDPLNLCEDHTFIFSYRSFKWLLNKNKKYY